jgi:hypothetical protein
MREYELLVMLTKQEKIGLAEWCESTTVEAKSLEAAGKMAKTFGRQEAKLAGAKMEDAYAIDMETNEHSD